jgi:hypothetical protein
VGPVEPQEEALRARAEEPLAPAVEEAEQPALVVGERALLEPQVVERRAAGQPELVAAVVAAKGVVVEQPAAQNTCGPLASTCRSRHPAS